MEYRLRTPLSPGDVERLRVGDIVYLSGLIFTARDEAHKKILEEINAGRQLPFNPEGLALYHCGPVARRRGGGWEIIAAGPTTSMRMESVEAEFIEKTGVRMVIGKGGMGSRTAEAMRRYKAVYAVFTGGAGALAAEAIRRVVDVYWLDELGIPEAVWLLEVEDFGPLIATIDTTGRNYYEERRREVLARAEEVARSIRLEDIVG